MTAVQMSHAQDSKGSQLSESKRNEAGAQSKAQRSSPGNLEKPSPQFPVLILLSLHYS